MSLFPAYIVNNLDTSSQTETETMPKEYEIDYETGQLTGRVVEGLEAIKIWIWLAMQIQRYRYTIFTWDYGNELESLIGKGYTKEYIDAEVLRMTEESLLINKNIISITNFSTEMKNEKLTITFIANTLYGEVTINV